MAVAARRLLDPVAIIGVNNLPVDGPDRSSLTRDFMTMTVAVIIAGLLPIMWGSGTGSEVIRC